PLAQVRVFAVGHVAQDTERVQDAGRVTGRDVGVLAQLGPDGQEDRVEASGQVGDRGVQFEPYAHVDDPGDLHVEHVPRQAVGGNAVPHHAAGLVPGVPHRHGVAEQPQVVRRGEAGRTGADDEHALAGWWRGDRDCPPTTERLVAQEALDRVDADR